jgi:hypothetical protein
MRDDSNYSIQNRDLQLEYYRQWTDYYRKWHYHYYGPSGDPTFMSPDAAHPYGSPASHYERTWQTEEALRRAIDTRRRIYIFNYAMIAAIAAYIIVCLKEEYDFRDHQQYSKLRDQALRERLARKSQKLAAVEAGDPGPSPTAEVPATEQEGKSLPK